MFTEIQGVGNTSLSSQGQSDWYYKRPKKRSNAFQELLDGELEETDAVETLMESALPQETPETPQDSEEREIRELSEDMEKLLRYAGLLGLE